jgi:streptogramin lyase
MTHRLLATIAVVLLLGTSTSASDARLHRGDPSTGTVVTIAVDGTPLRIVATGRTVWVAAGLRGIARIDPRTNETVSRIRPGGAVVDVAVGFGAVWAVDVFRGRLLRIEPHESRVVGSTLVGELPSGVAVGHGLVWVTSQLASTVSGIDPATGRVVKLVRFSSGELWPGGIAITRDGVWVVTGAGNELTLVDPKRMAVARRVTVRGARSLAVTGRSLWVGLARSDELLRVDSDAVSRVVTRGFGSGGYGPVLAGGSRLWLATEKGVAVVDPATGAVRTVLRFPRERTVAAIGVAGDIWVADQDHATLVRVRARPAPGGLLAAVAASPLRLTRAHPNG